MSHYSNNSLSTTATLCSKSFIALSHGTSVRLGPVFVQPLRSWRVNVKFWFPTIMSCISFRTFHPNYIILIFVYPFMSMQVLYFVVEKVRKGIQFLIVIIFIQNNDFSRYFNDGDDLNFKISKHWIFRLFDFLKILVKIVSNYIKFKFQKEEEINHSVFTVSRPQFQKLTKSLSYNFFNLNRGKARI